jgi:diketogulonate reductase-like aldo/keto reductase
MVYRNQDEVGRALKKVIPSVVSREQLFITSKLWNSSHQPEVVEAELDETLKQLGLTYLDLYREHIHSQRVLVNESRDCSYPLARGFRSREWSLPAQVRWRGAS